MRRVIGLSLAIAILAATAGCAARQARVWTVARAQLPNTVERVVFVDLSAVQRSEIGEWMLAEAERRLGMFAGGAREVRRACAIELMTAQAVFAETRDGGGVFVHIPGVNRELATACLARLGAVAERRGTFTAFHDGSLSGPIVGWIAWPKTPREDVMVVALDVRDPAKLGALLGGEGALAKNKAITDAMVDVDDAAPMWGVLVPGSGGNDQAAAFNVRLGGGDVSAELHLLVGGWAKAYLMARMARKEIGREMRDKVKSLSVDAEGEEVVIRVLFTTKQVKQAIGKVFD